MLRFFYIDVIERGNFAILICQKLHCLLQRLYITIFWLHFISTAGHVFASGWLSRWLFCTLHDLPNWLPGRVLFLKRWLQKVVECMRLWSACLHCPHLRQNWFLFTFNGFEFGTLVTTIGVFGAVQSSCLFLRCQCINKIIFLCKFAAYNSSRAVSRVKFCRSLMLSIKWTGFRMTSGANQCLAV